MKKIITAIGEQNLNEELKKYETLKIITSDIQYREGILEVLENEKDVDILIFNEEIQGNIEFEELIDTVKLINRNIEIIIILKEENEEKINYLKNKKINNIFNKNNFNTEKIINLIFENKINNNINLEIKNNNVEEIQKIKNNYEKNNIINLKIKKKNKIKNNFIKIKNLFKKKKIIKKIITISGISGVGKSVFTVNLANTYAKGKNKILIIDFDILNNCIHTLYGVNKYPKKIKENIEKNNFIKELSEDKLNIKKLIININNKIDLISGIDIILNNNKLNINEFYYLFEELKKEYNLILVDTSTECFFEYTRMIMKCSDEVLFLLEGNLIQIKKSINLLNIYTNNWNINNEKINIIINKKTKETIDENILKNIFSDFYIIGNIKFSKIYNTLINKNMKVKNLNKKIKKEYKKISRDILKENNICQFGYERKTG